MTSLSETEPDVQSTMFVLDLPVFPILDPELELEALTL